MTDATAAFLAHDVPCPRPCPRPPLPFLPSLPFPTSPCHDTSSSGKPYPTSTQTPTEVVASGGLDGGAMPAWWPRSKVRSTPSAHSRMNRAAAGV